jgi:UDP-N-acetyl-D-mannosaminuronic acid dehydrogenase
MKAKETLCSDPYIVDSRFVPMEDVLEQADVVIIGAPHQQYRDLATDKPVADIWGITGRGVLV